MTPPPRTDVHQHARMSALATLERTELRELVAGLAAAPS